MADETQTESTQGNNSSVSEFAQMVIRAEKANAEAKEILRRQEELAARNLLGGQTTSGIQPQIKKEETAKEYAEKILNIKK